MNGVVLFRCMFVLEREIMSPAGKRTLPGGGVLPVIFGEGVQLVPWKGKHQKQHTLYYQIEIRFKLHYIT